MAFRGFLPFAYNKARYRQILTLVDDDTGDPIDLTSYDIVFEIVDPDDPDSALLSATTDNGKITLVDTGTFQVDFTATEMKTLLQHNYPVGCTIAAPSEDPVQFIAGTLPVLEGNVSS